MFTIKKLSSKLPMNIRRMGSNTIIKEFSIGEAMIISVVGFAFGDAVSRSIDRTTTEENSIERRIQFEKIMASLDEIIINKMN